MSGKKTGANRTSCIAQQLIFEEKASDFNDPSYIICSPKILEDIEDMATFDPNNVSICCVSLSFIYH